MKIPEKNIILDSKLDDNFQENYYTKIQKITLADPFGGTASIFQSISSTYFFLSLYTALTLVYFG